MVQFNGKVGSESVVEVKTGDPGVVTWCQVDNLTHNWLAEHFVVDGTLPPGS